jgi:cytochrome P450
VVASDPPDHKGVRSVMVKRLRLGRPREVAPLADQVAAELLDTLGAQKSFDAARDIARPFVTRFVGRVLGIPESILDQCVWPGGVLSIPRSATSELKFRYFFH